MINNIEINKYLHEKISVLKDFVPVIITNDDKLTCHYLNTNYPENLPDEVVHNQYPFEVQTLPIDMCVEEIFLDNTRIVVNLENKFSKEVLELYGINVYQNINQVIYNEIVKRLFTKITEVAHDNYLLSYSRLDDFKMYIYRWFNKTYEKKITINDPKEIIDTIYYEINQYNNKFRCESYNNIICSDNIIEYLHAYIDRKPVSPDAYKDFGNVISYIGKLGSLNVYRHHNVNKLENKVFLIKTTKEHTQGFYIFLKENMVNIREEDPSLYTIDCQYSISDIGPETQLQYKKLNFKINE